MLKNISEKNKFYGLLVGFGIMVIICYKVAISSTLEIAGQYRILKKRALVAIDIPKKTSVLNQELKELNSKYFNSSENRQESHEVILEKISRISSDHSVLLIGYPAQHTFKTSSVVIETHAGLLRGGFIDLLRVLYALENSEHVGRISSIEFYTETDRKTKTKYLFSRIYIQNYHNLSDYEN
jgi:hypothetical protein